MSISEQDKKPTAIIKIDKDFIVGETDPRLFSSFIEQMGRAVYGGIYEPTHPTADENGFRGDVKSLINELMVPSIRYPGGNFVSGYNWEDGIGPKELRPTRLETAWLETETNEIGTDEFLTYCESMGIQPLMTVNLGTATAIDAKNLVEYCNFKGGTYYSDLRIKNGHKEPYSIKTWCLGNEMDGEWQIGHKSAEEYGKIAVEASRFMKAIDPTIETVLCGSSSVGMQTYPDWEITVLDKAYDCVDYISLHEYFENNDNDTPSFVACPITAESHIEQVAGICDAIQARKRSKKKMMLSFDEWNVWNHTCDDTRDPWSIAPPILEEKYTMEDALVVGGMFIVLLRHCDRVKIACLAQLVNIIAPIMTKNGGAAWRQTTFYPFRDVSLEGRGTVLDLRLKSPTYQCKRFGEVPTVDAAAVENTNGDISIFAVNRAESCSLPIEIDLSSFGVDNTAIITHTALKSDSPYDGNTAEEPNRVIPVEETAPTLTNGIVSGVLLPFSWNTITVKRSRKGGN